ncbi:uncharacterized protein LOC123309706 isoform X2 [Coccinella septempunctata]|uniref:uncharacterized protein LOC123309706 isoform X2 n=1 Tax=Coccinella septempunctata TaxID=41139 RepID=UPI001D097DC4|nr:uncharacterized protein LOC123309706 isoform X2 [Coccinella septempunctata]
MNIKISNKPILCQIGTQPAPYESDKPCDGTLTILDPSSQVIPNVSTRLESRDLNDQTALNSFDSSLSIWFDAILLLHHHLWQRFLNESSVWLLDILLILLLSKTRVVFSKAKSDCCVKVRIQGQSTVRSLHAGTLVTYWTTAPSIPLLKSPKAQLASLLLLICTLTVATRCYASSSSANGHIDQAQSTPTFSPLDNSKIHSSNLVLSRLIRPHFVQQKYPPLGRPNSRTKRSVGGTDSNLIPDDPFPKTKGRFEPQEEVRVQNLVGGRNYHNPGISDGQVEEVASDIHIDENLSDVVSVTGNFSRVISEKLNYSIPEVGRPDKQLFQEQDRRLMPPADGHENNSYAVGCERRRDSWRWGHGTVARRTDGRPRPRCRQRAAGAIARAAYGSRCQSSTQYSHAGRRGPPLLECPNTHPGRRTGGRNISKMHQAASESHSSGIGISTTVPVELGGPPWIFQQQFFEQRGLDHGGHEQRTTRRTLSFDVFYHKTFGCNQQSKD